MNKIIGKVDRPRVTVTKSNKFIYTQLIDDVKMVTLASAKGDKSKATEVGDELAKKILAKKIKKVVFDRNGYIYHGRVKAIADALRKAGLEL